MLIVQLHLRQTECLVSGQNTVLEVSSCIRMERPQVKQMDLLGLDNLHFELWKLLSLFDVTIVVVLRSASEAADLEPGEEDTNEGEDESEGAKDNICCCVVAVVARFLNLKVGRRWRRSGLDENGCGGGEG